MYSTARIFLLNFAFLLAFAGCEKNDSTEPADLVFTNAYVYTVDKDRTVTEALAIRGNEIVFVGSAEGVEQFVGESTDVRDMRGAMLMPGIHDMHIHALGTVEPETCDLASAS